MIKILFLCHGNICRSPMAEFVMKGYIHHARLDNDIHIESAALHRDELGNDIHWGTKEILERYHIPYASRQARLAIKADYKEFDYIVGMDHYNMRDMLRLFNNDPARKCSLMMNWVGISRDVADPWYTGDFDTTYADIDAGCIALLSHIKQNLKKGF